MVTYYLEDVPDDLWEDWKNTFPREKSINTRLLELIEEDTKE